MKFGNMQKFFWVYNRAKIIIKKITNSYKMAKVCRNNVFIKKLLHFLLIFFFFLGVIPAVVQNTPFYIWTSFSCTLRCFLSDTYIFHVMLRSISIRIKRNNLNCSWIRLGYRPYQRSRASFKKTENQYFLEIIFNTIVLSMYLSFKKILLIKIAG